MALEDKALEPSAEKLMRKTSKKKRRAPDPDIALKEEILDIIVFTDDSSSSYWEGNGSSGISKGENGG
ncbi:hypothetical protein Dimus_036210 [Dionaea muscipula]